MSRSFGQEVVRRIAAAWLQSDWLNAQIDQHRPKNPRFQKDEAADFGRYLWHALTGAPTHALPKMPYNLILDLGIAHDGLNPGARTQRIPQSFGTHLVKMDCNRRFGPSVMFGVVDDALVRVRRLGRIDYVLRNAAHFGYGRLYGELLADGGLISEIRNTAGRGDEVFPLGADTSDPKCARLGTNPITLTAPLGGPGEAHFSVDAATTPMSFGTMAFYRHTGEPLPEGCAVTGDGKPTTDAKAGARLVHRERLGNGLGLYMEGLAAVMGGGPPNERCRRVGERPGGSADWIVTVMSPEYLACIDGDALARLKDRLEWIVSGNGTARLPGTGRPRVSTNKVHLEGAPLEALLRMADEGKVSL